MELFISPLQATFFHLLAIQPCKLLAVEKKAPEDVKQEMEQWWREEGESIYFGSDNAIRDNRKVQTEWGKKEGKEQKNVLELSGISFIKSIEKE